jgi:hypothetical protein
MIRMKDGAAGQIVFLFTEGVAAPAASWHVLIQPKNRQERATA